MLEIGTIKCKLPQDQDFEFPPSDWKIIVEKNSYPYEIYAVKGSDKIFITKTLTGYIYKFTSIEISEKAFIIKYLKYGYLVYHQNDEWNILNFNNTNHITEKGLYFWNAETFHYIDFKTFSETMKIFESPNIYFYKKYIILEHQSSVVYVNSKDLPENINLDLLTNKISSYDKIIKKQKVSINFKDCVKNVKISRLNKFKSNFIKDLVMFI